MAEPQGPATAHSTVNVKYNFDLAKIMLDKLNKLKPDYSNFGEWSLDIRQYMEMLGLDAIVFNGADPSTVSKYDIIAAKFVLNNLLPSKIDASKSLHEMWTTILKSVPSDRDRRVAAHREMMQMPVYTFSSIAEYKQSVEEKFRLLAATTDPLTATEAYQLSMHIVATLPEYLVEQRTIYEYQVVQRFFDDASDPTVSVNKLLDELIKADKAVKAQLAVQTPNSKSGPVATSGIAPKASSSAFPATSASNKRGNWRSKKFKGKGKKQGDRRGDPLGRHDDSSGRVSKPNGNKQGKFNMITCYYCGRKGHKEAECRNKAQNEERKAINLKQLHDSDESAMTVQVQPTQVAMPVQPAPPTQVEPPVQPKFTFIDTTFPKGKGKPKAKASHEDDVMYFSAFPAHVAGNNGPQPHHQAAQGPRRILVDTGATITIFNTPEPFDEIRPSKHKIQGLAGVPITATGEGSAAIVVSGHLIEIPKALYVPQAQLNLLAPKTVGDLRFTITPDAFVIHQAGLPTVSIPWVDVNTFALEFYLLERVSVAVTPSTHPWCLWHRRFGHPSPSKMEEMRRAGYPVPATPPDLADSPLKYCETCPLAKLTRTSLRQSTEIDPQYTAGSRWNVDTMGPITPPDINGNRYGLIIVDHATRRISGHLMPTRDLTFRQIAAQFEWQLAQQPGMTLKEIRLDNAAEFRSHAFNTWAESRGIVLTYSPAHSPAHNGTAESAVKAVSTIMRSLLFQSNLPAAYWGYAALQGIRLLNLWPRRLLNGMSPQQAFDGRPEEILIRSFGCLALVPFPTGYNAHLDKLQPRRFRAIYLGNVHPKISKFLSIDGLRIFTATTADVIFDEDSNPGLERTLPHLNEKVQFDTRMVTIDDAPLPPLTGQADSFLLEFLNNRRLGPPIVAAEGEMVPQPGATQPRDLRPALEAHPGVPDAARQAPRRGRPPGSKNKPKQVTSPPVPQVPAAGTTPSASMPVPVTADQPGVTEPVGPGDSSEGIV
ncbi:MAG: DDE-type integrase/transposase/recombinase, partial [Limisphaerales bacterium]